MKNTNEAHKENKTPVVGKITYHDRELYELDVTLLKGDPAQPRKHFDQAALSELARSIEHHGVLQPVLFRVTDDGEHMIVAGERRLRAARKAGLATIPAIYIQGKALELALVENLLREDMTPIEEAEALGEMQNAYGYSHEDLARVLGRSRASITETLSINRLPDTVRDDCRGSNKCSKTKLVEIAREKSPKQMEKLYQRVVKMNMSREELKKYRADKPKKVNDNLDTLVRMLGNRLDKPLPEMDKARQQKLKLKMAELEIKLRHILGQLEDQP